MKKITYLTPLSLLLLSVFSSCIAMEPEDSQRKELCTKSGRGGGMDIESSQEETNYRRFSLRAENLKHALSSFVDFLNKSSDNISIKLNSDTENRVNIIQARAGILSLKTQTNLVLSSFSDLEKIHKVKLGIIASKSIVSQGTQLAKFLSQFNNEQAELIKNHIEQING